MTTIVIIRYYKYGTRIVWFYYHLYYIYVHRSYKTRTMTLEPGAVITSDLKELDQLFPFDRCTCGAKPTWPWPMTL